MGPKTSFWLLALFLAFALPHQGGAAEEKHVAFGQDRLGIKTANGIQRFTVEIARTPEQQQRGLMHRNDIPDNHGMLFIQERDRQVRMWMKDTPHPLDMLFIDKHGQIVYIASGKPNSLDMITVPQPVRAVLELPGGTAEKQSIRVGDRVIHSYFMMP